MRRPHSGLEQKKATSIKLADTIKPEGKKVESFKDRTLKFILPNAAKPVSTKMIHTEDTTVL